MKWFWILLILAGCKDNYSIETFQVGDETWFKCRRWANNFSQEDLKICNRENLDDCIKLCNKHRKKVK